MAFAVLAATRSSVEAEANCVEGASGVRVCAAGGGTIFECKKNWNCEGEGLRSASGPFFHVAEETMEVREEVFRVEDGT